MLNPSVLLRVNSVKHLVGKYSPAPDSSPAYGGLRMTGAGNFKDIPQGEQTEKPKYQCNGSILWVQGKPCPLTWFDMLTTSGES